MCLARLSVYSFVCPVDAPNLTEAHGCQQLSGDVVWKPTGQEWNPWLLDCNLVPSPSPSRSCRQKKFDVNIVSEKMSYSAIFQLWRLKVRVIGQQKREKYGHCAYLAYLHVSQSVALSSSSSKFILGLIYCQCLKHFWKWMDGCKCWRSV